MSIDSRSQESNSRVTFRPSVEVLKILEKIPQGKKSDYINRILTEQKKDESSLRAARYKIAELEKRIINLENGCPKCKNDGKFFGIALGHSEHLLKETKITIYCECNAGHEQMRQAKLRFEHGLKTGALIKTDEFDTI